MKIIYMGAIRAPSALTFLPTPMATDCRFTTQHVINVLSILDIRSFSIYSWFLRILSHIHVYVTYDRSVLKLKYLCICMMGSD